MNHVDRQRTERQLRTASRPLVGLLVALLLQGLAIADGPIASSSFSGAEDPLSENGAWAALTSLSPNGTRFQKNNGAFADNFVHPDHAGARTTAAIPADHYSEIVIGHTSGGRAGRTGSTACIASTPMGPATPPPRSSRARRWSTAIACGSSRAVP